MPCGHLLPDAGADAAVDIRDTQIAVMALARRANAANRNVRHFGDLKVSIVNPWVAQVGNVGVRAWSAP
jgi:predicted nucleic acid-binding protein